MSLEEGYIDTDIQESINPLSVLLSVLAVEIGVISFLFVKSGKNQKKFLNEIKNSQEFHKYLNEIKQKIDTYITKNKYIKSVENKLKVIYNNKRNFLVVDLYKLDIDSIFVDTYKMNTKDYDSNKRKESNYELDDDADAPAPEAMKLIKRIYNDINEISSKLKENNVSLNFDITSFSDIELYYINAAEDGGLLIQLYIPIKDYKSIPGEIKEKIE